MRPRLLGRTYHKIFGIGLSKTGTSSLAAALNRLGIKTIHFPYSKEKKETLIQELGRLPILDTYQGVVDGVAWDFEFLDGRYPNSKFILTTRNIDSWIKSRQSHEEIIRGQKTKFTREEMTEYYTQHSSAVKKHFKNRKNDLLVMRLVEGDGWDVLCPFLGLSIPDLPFPRENEQRAMKSWLENTRSLERKLNSYSGTDSSFIFVDRDSFSFAINGSRTFLERNGEFWGNPPDDAIAIEELQKMRQSGCDFIAFPWTSFWWFDAYVNFYKYLCDKFPRVIDDDHLVVFDLRQ
ncbi:MAG: sulfotransferase [Gammaproteobacteria bacterium]|jgi:hypothetical protein